MHGQVGKGYILQGVLAINFGFFQVHEDAILEV